MAVDEAKEASRGLSDWRSVLSDYPTRDKALSYICICFNTLKLDNYVLFKVDLV